MGTDLWLPEFLQEFRLRTIGFPQPVSIFIGLGFAREVSDVLDAYTLLNEWPESGRGSGHLLALHICAAVLGGHGTATDAQQALEAFAANQGILALDRLGTQRLPKACLTQ